jgi:hypothetical protein
VIGCGRSTAGPDRPEQRPYARPLVPGVGLRPVMPRIVACGRVKRGASPVRTCRWSRGYKGSGSVTVCILAWPLIR